MTLEFRKLKGEDLSLDLFKSFNRDQEVKKCWRRCEGQWVLKDIAFKESWNKEDYLKLLDDLRHTLENHGVLVGVFDQNDLVAFASLEGQYMGQVKRYLQMSYLIISKAYRSKGIGRKLFNILTMEAALKAADALYISSHSSQETKAFYDAMGCQDVEEINQRLYDIEPYDCHLEYNLDGALTFQVCPSVYFDQLSQLRWDFTLADRNIDELDLDHPSFIQECQGFFSQGHSQDTWSHWVVIVNDEVVSSISVNHIRKVPKPTLFMDEYAYVTNVYTKPEFRQRGLASRLMDHILTWAKERNFELMIVWPSRPAVNYYKKVGFKEQNDLMELVLREDA